MFAQPQQPVIIKNKKLKEDSDDEQPKGLHSGFYYFVGEMRQTLKPEFPDNDFKIAKEIAKRWKALGEQGQKPYNEYAEAHYYALKGREHKHKWDSKSKRKFKTVQLFTPTSSCSQNGA